MENYSPNYRGDSAVQNLAAISSLWSLGILQDIYCGANTLLSGSSDLSHISLLLYQRTNHHERSPSVLNENIVE